MMYNKYKVKINIYLKIQILEIFFFEINMKLNRQFIIYIINTLL